MSILLFILTYLNILVKVDEYKLATETFWSTSALLIARLLSLLFMLPVKRQQQSVKCLVVSFNRHLRQLCSVTFLVKYFYSHWIWISLIWISTMSHVWNKGSEQKLTFLKEIVLLKKCSNTVDSKGKRNWKCSYSDQRACMFSMTWSTSVW